MWKVLISLAVAVQGKNVQTKVEKLADGGQLITQVKEEKVVNLGTEKIKVQQKLQPSQVKNIEKRAEAAASDAYPTNTPKLKKENKQNREAFKKEYIAKKTEEALRTNGVPNQKPRNLKFNEKTKQTVTQTVKPGNNGAQLKAGLQYLSIADRMLALVRERVLAAMAVRLMTFEVADLTEKVKKAIKAAEAVLEDINSKRAKLEIEKLDVQVVNRIDEIKARRK